MTQGIAPTPIIASFGETARDGPGKGAMAVGSGKDSHLSQDLVTKPSRATT
jgi:hypothetical protein